MTSNDFEDTIRGLARRIPSMSLDKAIAMYDEKGRRLAISLEGQDLEAVARWISTQPDIVAIVDTKKINAIKEVRARADLGLKEAKEGVEYFQAHREDIMTASPEEIAQAIASIREGM